MKDTEKHLSFKEWCEVNGRSWHMPTERSFTDYEAYINQCRKDPAALEPECT